jgi:L,D-peptidoglycan transpeptidase YkuD (ErfK/YbiS/YcfS/YnhG family)
MQKNAWQNFAATMNNILSYLVFIFFILFNTLSSYATSSSFRIPNDTQQIIVGLTSDWSDSHVTLYLLENGINGWEKIGKPWEGRVGREGLAWGRGLHPENLSGPVKTEGDACAPAGIFKIGYTVYGYEDSCPRNSHLRYYQVTPYDIWVEDTSSPLYNQHRRLPILPQTDWEKKQQMRLDDPAHALKVFIYHNAPPKAKPGAGSAIFFHIWRQDGDKATTGCVAMSRPDMEKFLMQLDPLKYPLLILLPQPIYDQYQTDWQLPWFNP